MLRVLILNLVFLVIVAAFTYLQTTLVFVGSAALQGITISLVIVVFFIVITYFLWTSNAYLTEHNWKNSVSKKKFKTILQLGIRPGLLFGGLTISIVLLSFISLQFYSSLGGFLGSLVSGLLLFVFFIYALSAQYFLPIHIVQNNTIRKSLKKGFLIAIDNPLFSISILLAALLFLGISVFTAFLFPGIAGVAYLFCCATKLRILKYDADNPQKPNWAALLAEERKRTGSRSFISFIFPWK